jgi:hypothetical protein
MFTCRHGVASQNTVFSSAWLLVYLVCDWFVLLKIESTRQRSGTTVQLAYRCCSFACCQETHSYWLLFCRHVIPTWKVATTWRRRIGNTARYCCHLWHVLLTTWSFHSQYQEVRINPLKTKRMCLFWDPYKTHKRNMGTTQNFWMLNWWYVKFPLGFKRLNCEW